MTAGDELAREKSRLYGLLLNAAARRVAERGSGPSLAARERIIRWALAIALRAATD